MAIVVARTFTVAAAAPAVLAYLIDFGHAVEWDPATRQATRADSGPIVVGSSWRTDAKVLALTAELRYTLGEAGPDRLVFTGHGESATSATTFTLRPVLPGTELTYRMDLEMHGVAKLVTPVVKLEVEKLATRAATRLAGILDRPDAQDR